MRRNVLDNDDLIGNTNHNLEQLSSILWPAAMPSLTVENYVKAIYQLSHGAADGAIATGQISAALGVLPGTVTSMLKTLDESNLATYTPYEGVRLTPSGRGLALRVLRRHRLIEQFLTQTLNLSWDEVHEEAEHMEHAVSDALVDRIDAYLGHPTTDPHGDPIPRADGTVAPASDRPLVECAVGDRFCVARVVDQSSEFLRFLSQAGVTIGTQGSLVSSDAKLERVTIRVGEDEKTLPRAAALKLMIR
jgi:DtxR family Mn-dependent transcriptional regulator